MAGQQYYEEPADQEYYGEEEMAAGGTGEDLTALASVPWVAIAFAVHVILLVIAWFVVPQLPPPVKTKVIETALDFEPIPPEPEMKLEEDVEWPKDEEPQTDPTEDPRIVEEAEDDHNEDPSDSPNEDLAENPNEDDSPVESPHPNRGPNSSVGLGGGAGGGGGRGGRGGFAYRRARGGGGRPYMDRTRAALDWLRDHQNYEGYWSSTGFSDDSNRKTAKKTYNIDFENQGKVDGDIGWEATIDVGLTGMSLLAFVGAGYDHRTGDYKDTCRRAIMYLRKVQGNDGCFGPKEDDHFVYNHAICSMAMAEAYGLTMDRVLKPLATKAVEFILKIQNPGLGWRYGDKPGINDSSVTGWMVLSLKSHKMAGIEFDSSKCYSDAAKWYDTVTIDYNGYPKCGYDSPASNNARLRSATDYDNNPSMDSIYVMSMLFMGKADLKDKTIKALAKICVEQKYLPSWEHMRIDYYYWYYASLALYQVGGPIWKTWEKAMSKTLLDYQRGYHKNDKAQGLTNKDSLDEHGSWDPIGAWGSAGGRVYATAINCLTLEVWYRYQRINRGS